MDYSTSKKYNYDMPTAAKTHYQEYSPSRKEFDTPSLKSPSRYSMKIQEARQSLSHLIGEVSSKKSLNSEAIDRVRYTNKEALGLLSCEDDDLSTYTPKRSYYQAPQRGYKTSEFVIPYSPVHHEETYPARNINEFQIDDVPNIVSYTGHKSLEEENLELRRALNEQIRANNQLMHKIQELEEENDYLRKSVHQGTSAAVFGGVSSPVNNSHRRQQSGQVPSSILRQLDELKRENELLRKDTIGLLQNKRAVF